MSDPGTPNPQFAPVPPLQQQPPLNPPMTEDEKSKKLLAGLLGIILGAFGVHKFILGYTTEGIVHVCVSLFTCFFGAPVMHIIGIVEGIIYLTKTDEDFVRTYVRGRKGWF